MFKSIMLSAVVALTLSACAHNTVAGKSCACGKDKVACAENKECPMHKEVGCTHCKTEDKAAATGK